MKFMGYEVQVGYKGTTVLVFYQSNSLGGAENMCPYLSEKHLHNDLFWQDFLMAGSPFGCLFQRTSPAW